MIQAAAWIFLALVVGFTLGWHFGIRRGVQKATDLTLATVAMTAYVTYGEDWWEDFLGEMKTVKVTEQTLIRALVREMEESR